MADVPRSPLLPLSPWEWSACALLVALAAAVLLLLLENRRLRRSRAALDRALSRHRDTESQLRKLATVVEQTADAVLITDPDGVIEYVNPGYQAMTGYSSAEALGGRPSLVKSGVHEPEFYRRLWATITAGETFRGVLVNRRKDGSLYYEEKTVTPLKDRTGHIAAFVSTGKDISDRRFAEERAREHEARLVRVARLTTIGEMSTALAHELNQPLAAIANFAGGARRRIEAGTMQVGDTVGILQHIAEQTEHAAAIIRRMRGFVGQRRSRREPLNVNDPVREALAMVEAEVRHERVGVRLELEEGLPAVMADALQIEQAVLNLVRNAIEAIGRAAPAERTVTVTSERHGEDGVCVCVRDTGPGIPATHREALLEGFFTAREDDEGLGMGLGITRSIVESHGGSLWVKSNEYAGAVVCFALPGGERRQNRRGPQSGPV